MTNEEAIKILKEDRETYQDFINQGYADNEDIKRGLLALDMSIEALEKQIPKKKRKRNECPECGYSYAFEEYCPNCGQALEWEDEDESPR